MAEQLGYDPTYISMIETGRWEISDVTTRLRIARHLGLPAHALGVSDPDNADFAAMLQFGESTIRLAVIARQSGHSGEAVHELWPLITRLEGRVADGYLERDVMLLRFDPYVLADVNNLDGSCPAARSQIWSGVLVPRQKSFADLHLWLAWFLPGFAASPPTMPPNWPPNAAPSSRSASVCGSAFAYLVVRRTSNGAKGELGAYAYGIDGYLAVTAMAEQIQAWYREGRHTTPALDYLAGRQRPLADSRRLQSWTKRTASSLSAGSRLLESRMTGSTGHQRPTGFRPVPTVGSPPPTPAGPGLPS